MVQSTTKIACGGDHCDQKASFDPKLVMSNIKKIFKDFDPI